MMRSVSGFQPVVCLRAAQQLYCLLRQFPVKFAPSTPAPVSCSLYQCSHASSSSSIPRPRQPKKPKGETHEVKHFVDHKRVVVRGGSGGNGCLSFASIPFKEWAGPDGGNGGNGGHVIFQASHSSRSLAHLTSIISAESGVGGRTRTCHGKNAEHKYIEVPVGTIVKTEMGTLIGSVEQPGDMLVVARGGAGGKGNYFFLSNESRAPAKAELGAQGQELRVHVEMQTVAHAGLIGFPNAGKSTLLRAISRARPKVAAYPFTTLNPHVGIVEYEDYEQVAVADIPGLINGAHLNRGLGISFLRHIYRCVCLLFVLDLSAADPATQLSDLKFELEQYETGLSSRPHAVIGNKLDLPGSQEALEELQEKIDLPVFAISAKRRIGLDPLLEHLRKMYDASVEKDSE